MPGIAAEPPGAMSHLPSLSTGSVRVIAGGEDVKPVVLQLIGMPRPLLQMIIVLAMAAEALTFPCIIRQAEGSCIHRRN